MGPQKGYLAILAGHPDDGGGDDEGDKDAAKKDAMDQFIAAVHDKDTDAALDAYDSLCSLHEPDGDEGDSDKY